MERPRPLSPWTESGWRVAWMDDFNNSLWIVDECRVILADSRLSQRRVADALWSELCGPTSA